MIGVGIYLFGRERQFVVDSISSFWVGPPLTAFIILTALHMDIGMRTIIEDYVHSGHRKLALIFASSLFSWGICIVCIVCADSDVKPAGIPIKDRPPFRFEAGHDSNQRLATFRH